MRAALAPSLLGLAAAQSLRLAWLDADTMEIAALEGGASKAAIAAALACRGAG